MAHGRASRWREQGPMSWKES